MLRERKRSLFEQVNVKRVLEGKEIRGRRGAEKPRWELVGI